MASSRLRGARGAIHIALRHRRGSAVLALAVTCAVAGTFAATRALGDNPSVYYAQTTIATSSGAQTLDVWKNTALGRVTLQWDGDPSTVTVVNGDTITLVENGAAVATDTYPTVSDAWAFINRKFGITEQSVDNVVASGQALASEPAASTANADSLASLTSSSNQPVLQAVGPTGAVGVMAPSGAAGDATSLYGPTGATGVSPDATASVTAYSTPNMTTTHYNSTDDLKTHLSFPIPYKALEGLTPLYSPYYQSGVNWDIMKSQYYGPGTMKSGWFASFCYGQDQSYHDHGNCDVMVDVAVPTKNAGSWGARYRALLNASKYPVLIDSYRAAIINPYQAILEWNDSTYIAITTRSDAPDQWLWQYWLNNLAHNSTPIEYTCPGETETDGDGSGTYEYADYYYVGGVAICGDPPGS